MTGKTEQIQINLEILDFEKIQKAMTALGWTWKDPKAKENRVPTEKEIATMAEYCMNTAWVSENKICQIGGFEAEVISGVISIKFVLDKAEPLSHLLNG